MVTRAAAPTAGLEETSEDAWLDELEPRQERARFLQGRFVRPMVLGRRGKAFLQTTPGKLIAMMVVLTTSLLAAGLSMSQSMSLRNQSLDTVLNATEPMSAAAHVLSTSLLRADTVAAGSFVQAGPLSEEDMRTYTAALDQAVSSASEIYKGAVEADSDTSREIEDLVINIQRDLPIYSGLNARAQVNQRMGNPVGVAYMSQASAIMRTRILSSAQELNTLTRQDVADEMRRLSQPQWITLSGFFAALGFLLLAQWWLWLTFRRRFNRGFLAATLAVIIAISWAGVSNFQSWRSGSVAYARAAQPWEELTAARIDALETRTDETFALLRRETASQSARDFTETYSSVAGAVHTAEGYGMNKPLIDDSRNHLNAWSNEHAELVAALNSGSYDQAAALLSTRGDDEGEASFRGLDGSLAQLIASSRESTRLYIAESLDATRRVSAAVALLSVLAVVCIWWGIRRRLGEYL